MTFTLQATGAQPLRYHWEFLSRQGYKWEPLSRSRGRYRIEEATETSTLTINRVQKSPEGQYRCIVSNGNGSVTSQPATLRLAGEKYALLYYYTFHHTTHSSMHFGSENRSIHTTESSFSMHLISQEQSIITFHQLFRTSQDHYTAWRPEGCLSRYHCDIHC